MQQPYTKNFFQDQRQHSLQSARQVVPVVMELIQPRSIVDVGCGVGAWLSAFQEQGIEDMLGVDGDYVNRELLMIPQAKFRSYDLKCPFRVDREFDLAMCLEVAEHLPWEAAETLIESLTLLSPVVLFSAAVPHQGGVFHVNEQWQEFWQNQFVAQGYRAIDCIRGRIWENTHVEWFYAQNTFLYVRADCLERYPALQSAAESGNPMPARVVHPGMFLGLVYNSDPENIRVGDAWKILLTSLKCAIRRRMGRKGTGGSR
ncbi:MAG TPA: class I SAM-dependent methyltransferase [Chthonomonadaceae bacterium]|nr:class I SAM-dependent methyltransferase [Chthonomonadaceae bacterium]